MSYHAHWFDDCSESGYIESHSQSDVDNFFREKQILRMFLES